MRIERQAQLGTAKARNARAFAAALEAASGTAIQLRNDQADRATGRSDQSGRATVGNVKVYPIAENWEQVRNGAL